MSDLRSVSDETLYLRLTLLAHRLPTDYKELDYEYRRDLWETVNKAIRAEIRRRKAPPPPWWSSSAAREQAPARRRRYAAGYLASIAAAGLLVTMPALTPLVLLVTLGCGTAWLLPHMRDTGFRRTPRR
ncbi:hypothetical protein [Catellatospora methionotrophica]|uniref:hypothetical protein n=1 Tax=Catellatospora methionotrophica TaxID=121620 RepID=UPI0033CF94B9